MPNLTEMVGVMRKAAKTLQSQERWKPESVKLQLDHIETHRWGALGLRA